MSSCDIYKLTFVTIFFVLFKCISNCIYRYCGIIRIQQVALQLVFFYIHIRLDG